MVRSKKPLFSSYVFVKIDPRNYLEVLKTSGVVKVIRFSGKLVSIPDAQIAAVQHYVETNEIINDDPFLDDLKPGCEVEVYTGPMKGLKGTIEEIKGDKKVMVQIDAIGKELYLTILGSCLKEVKGI